MTEERFQYLRDAWKEDTWHVASPKKKATHWAYQQIIGGGDKSLPFIIDDLKEETDHWFWALRAITGEDPVPEEHRGRMDKMAQDWIEWYEQQ